MEKRRPLIADLKRNALDDGPGIRTTVFFKGCPLSCTWCHNPECQEAGPEILFNPAECRNCGECLRACPHGAMPSGDPGRIDRKLCQSCGLCVEACPGRGRRMIGKFYPAEELARLLAQDLPFFKNSGGGVTFSGGEPTVFLDYLGDLARLLKEKGVHLNIETTGFFNFNKFAEKVLPFLDLIYFDLKFADSSLHSLFTGQPNAEILENFRGLVRQNSVPVLPRIPLIPEVTASRENLQNLARFLKELGIARLALLPYNPLWIPKSKNLGKNPEYRRESWLTAEEKREYLAIFNDFTLEREL
ncbi:MAG: glycyl-radical enzyme activating protein [Proteobacteria bacterium]|nr:glycyl-radical enzyme activating protein [Pseudomonadota bacterium]